MTVVPFPTAPEPDPKPGIESLPLGSIFGVLDSVVANLESLGRNLIDTYGEKTVSEVLDDVKDKPIKDLFEGLF